VLFIRRREFHVTVRITVAPDDINVEKEIHGRRNYTTCVDGTAQHEDDIFELRGKGSVRVRRRLISRTLRPDIRPMRRNFRMARRGAQRIRAQDQVAKFLMKK